jgi:pimeloyl-ACP methyl ester carboxylesterase
MAILAACSAGQRAVRVDAAALAASAGLRRIDVSTGTFSLVSYVRFGNAPVLRVYIEGDGHAWLTRTRPSDDPTPWDPVALKLAAVDPAPSVAYLARPCQYVAPASDRYCQEYYWTDGRYAEPVIAGMNAAIDRLLLASGARTLELVGFSGGGAVAVLIAARRRDVINIRTVAAVLDTAAWTGQQHLGPLTGSLNPADFTDALADIPQHHFSGAEDTIVNDGVTRTFVGRFSRLGCVTAEIVAGVGHADGWDSRWPRLLREAVRCADPANR